MSAISYYLSKGETPQQKTVTVSGLDTFTVWAPASDKKVVLTNLLLSSNSNGTIAFYFDNGNDKFAEFAHSGTNSVSLDIGCIQSTVEGGRIFAKLGGASGTDAFTVNVTGFEI